MKTSGQIMPTVIQGLTTPMPQRTTSNAKFAEWLRFDTFGDPELVKVVDGCAEWYEAFKANQQPRWLSLIGNSGTGKTHCAKRLWKWASVQVSWADCTYFAKAVYWPDFVQELRSGNAYQRRDDMKRWPVLFLDDIGAERDPNGFAAEELNTLLGCRMDKWTILTSNLDIDGIKRVDQRIASRLIRGHNICIGINTKDYSTR